MAAQAAWYQGWLPERWDGFNARLPIFSLLVLAILFSAWVYAYLDIKVNFWQPAGLLLVAGLLWLDANPARLPDVLWSNTRWQLQRIDFILAALTCIWAFMLGQAALAALRLYRRTTQPFARNRVKYLAPVMGLVVLGQVFFLARYWALGSLIHLAGFLLAAYAVLNKRLPSLRRVFMRGVSALLTGGIAVTVFAGVFWLAQLVFRSASGLPDWFISSALAVLVVLLVLPVLNRLMQTVHRRVEGVSHDPTLLLRRYSQSISNILDIRLLAATAISLIDETLGAQKGDLFLVDPEKTAAGLNGYRVRSLLQKDPDETGSYYLAGDHPAVVYFNEQRAPLTRQEYQALPGFHSMPTLSSDIFNTPHLDIYLPVHAKGEWIGLLGLGPKSSGEPYWDDDRSVLSTLADQTAVALENARLVESLMRLNNEFRRAIEALNQANRNLERLDRAKTDFISIASHELLTPLTVLSGYGQMLQEDAKLASSPQYGKIISGIYNGTQRLNEIVEGMLDLAKIDLHELQLDPRPVSLEALVRSLVEELRPALDERQQSFEQQNLQELPAVEADKGALRKVFYHLLVNAIKNTPDGGRITLTGRAIQPLSIEFPKGGVQVTIRDTGVGIDPAVQELIFTKFYQTGDLALHSSGKTKYKGSGPGLGLAITRGIVEAHGGRVWVESPGYDEKTCPGSQFHVLLPLYQERREAPVSRIAA